MGTEWSELAASLSRCATCDLRAGARAPVFGDGPAEAAVMIVGEAPGATEDATGHPFVGRSGTFLTQLMDEIGLDRQSLFVTNAVKCRPPANRTPTRKELASCLPWLVAQIEAMAPQGILTVGNLSTSALLGTRGGISTLRGRFYDLTIGNHALWLRPLFHPAYLLRNRSRTDGSPIDLTLGDLRAVSCRLTQTASLQT